VPLEQVAQPGRVAPGLVVHDAGQAGQLGVNGVEHVDRVLEPLGLGSPWLVHRLPQPFLELLVRPVHDGPPERLFGAVPVVDEVMADPEPAGEVAHGHPVIAEFAERGQALGQDRLLGRDDLVGTRPARPTSWLFKHAFHLIRNLTDVRILATLAPSSKSDNCQEFP
jgi:hypothetical protein